MARPRFSLNRQDDAMLALVGNTDQKALARWAIDCAERVLPHFETACPEDQRPRQALATLQAWIATGVFRMATIRGASLAAHAAARDVGADSPAGSAARATGQAVATAHVPRHAYGAALYAQQAIYRATGSLEAVERERDWQYRHLLDLGRAS